MSERAAFPTLPPIAPEDLCAAAFEREIEERGEWQARLRNVTDLLARDLDHEDPNP